MYNPPLQAECNQLFGSMISLGARQISSGTSFCRINAAFHLATERRIDAAGKNSVVRPMSFHSQ